MGEGHSAPIGSAEGLCLGARPEGADLLGRVVDADPGQGEGLGDAVRNPDFWCCGLAVGEGPDIGGSQTGKPGEEETRVEASRERYGESPRACCIEQTREALVEGFFEKGVELRLLINED